MGKNRTQGRVQALGGIGSWPSGRALAAGSGGFTLIEVVIALGIVLIILGAVTPMIFQLVTTQRTDTTREKMKLVYSAIMGNGKTFQGFVGDIGRMPVTLSELVLNNNSLPNYAVNTTTGVGTGWRGPYLPQGPSGDDPLADAWGVPFAYDSTTGQIRSLGADHVLGTEDDIKLPDPAPASAQITGTVLVTVYVNSVPNPTGLSVTVWDTSNGNQLQKNPLVGVPGYAYTLMQGMHAVHALHTGTAIVGSTTTTYTVSKIIPFQVLPNSQTKVRIDLLSNADVLSQ